MNGETISNLVAAWSGPLNHSFFCYSDRAFKVTARNRVSAAVAMMSTLGYVSYRQRTSKGATARGNAVTRVVASWNRTA
jgi:hypothetical protein